MKRFISCILLALLFQAAGAQQPALPAVHSNIHYDVNGRLYYQVDGKSYYAAAVEPRYTLEQCFGKPVGVKNGIAFDFGDFEGRLTYGMIPYGDMPHPLPIFRPTDTLTGGKVVANIAGKFKGKYDFSEWQDKGQGVLGYRLTDASGLIVFDGEVAFRWSEKEDFQVLPTIYEGPFVSQPTEEGVTIWCNTTEPASVTLKAGDKAYASAPGQTHHVWTLNGLRPDTRYEYTVSCAGISQTYHFRTAPAKGSQTPFIFGYTSDSRNAEGGGERNIYGANGYIMKKIAALAYREGAAFMQFTGDLVDGYLNSYEETQVQYANWKKAVEPFWHYMPFNVGIGNHEALVHAFPIEGQEYPISIDAFPYATHSAEAAFAEAFVNPVNGPDSEDGCALDPNPGTVDFPSYRENVYYYTYGNVAMIVLNSDYWYAPSMKRDDRTGGGLHGYIMDQQLEWLRQVIALFEADPGIDHVFVTQHTPAFPNGGHSGDDMWYDGDNDKRPWIAGKPMEKGIIERRNEYLDILINQSTKVLAILTGDEHNYNYLPLTPEVPIHEADHPFQLERSRTIYQVNNGAAGAPYYAQETHLPWSEFTQSFSVENALCLFHIDGKRVEMVVINPDTLNEIDRVVSKE
jgi:hypothetical protein